MRIASHVGTVLVMALSLASAAWSADNITAPDFSVESARLSAMGLDIVVADETNVLGIDKWAGNPAGLILDEARSRVVLGHLSTNHDYFSESTPGAYGVWRNDRFAAQAQMNASWGSIDAGPDNRQQVYAAGAAARLGGLVVGANANRENETVESAGLSVIRTTSDPLGWSAGAGYVLPLANGGRAVFGGAYEADPVEVRTDVLTLNGTSTTSGEDTAVSAHAIVSGPGGAALGLRYVAAERDQMVLVRRYFVTDSETFGIRAFLPVSRFQFAAEWTHDDMDLAPLFFLPGEATRDALTAGAAVRLGAHTVGIEATKEKLDTDLPGLFFGSTSNRIRDLRGTLGAEFALPAGWLARASYGMGRSYDDELDDTEVTRALGAGLGRAWGTDAKVDASYNVERVADKADPQTVTKEHLVKLIVTSWFGGE